VDKSIQSPRHQALATLLREYREASGLSQCDLAAIIDEPQSFVSKFEGGVRRLDLVELEQVTHAFGVRLIDFVQAFEERQADEG